MSKGALEGVWDGDSDDMRPSNSRRDGENVVVDDVGLDKSKGAMIGKRVGDISVVDGVGAAEEFTAGCPDGVEDGEMDGRTEGDIEGISDGKSDGISEG
jgi:hypothetical protein